MTGFLADFVLCAQKQYRRQKKTRGVDLNINIYYGGRGIIDDPNIYARIRCRKCWKSWWVERYNLYDGKTNITTLPQTLKRGRRNYSGNDSGVVRYRWLYAAVSDARWLYGDKETIAGIYMCPVVMSTTYGEREGKLSLAAAWEIWEDCPAAAYADI